MTKKQTDAVIKVLRSDYGFDKTTAARIERQARELSGWDGKPSKRR